MAREWMSRAEQSRAEQSRAAPEPRTRPARRPRNGPEGLREHRMCVPIRWGRRSQMVLLRGCEDWLRHTSVTANRARLRGATATLALFRPIAGGPDFPARPIRCASSTPPRAGWRVIRQNEIARRCVRRKSGAQAREARSVPEASQMIEVSRRSASLVWSPPGLHKASIRRVVLR
jgi:hypothetical protein